MSRIIPTAVVLLSIVGGCHDPRFQKESDVRLARIHGHLAEYREHDAAGPQRLHETLELHRRLEEHRAASLQATCDLCRRQLKGDIDRWHDERQLRRSRIQAGLHGHPENIDETWAKMVY